MVPIIVVDDLQMSQLTEHVIIATTLLTLFVIFNYSLHRIEEGHVGVYYRVTYCRFLLFGDLLDSFLGRCPVADHQQPWVSYDGAVAYQL